MYKNRKLIGLECIVYLKPMDREIIFDGTEWILHDALEFYIWNLHYEIPMGLVPVEYDPMSQTTYVVIF